MPSVVVGLTEHIGDIIACEPVVRYLRAEMPKGTIISWVVREPFRELIDTHPLIDHTIVVECLTEWIVISKHKKHGSTKFDRVVDLHVNFRICSHCGVPLIKPEGCHPFVDAYQWLDYGSLLEAFSTGAGIPKLSDAPKLFIQEQHIRKVDALSLPKSFCVIHRRSNDKEKDWRDACWDKVALFLMERFKLPVVEIGQDKKARYRSLPGSINLVNKTGLLESAEIIRRAALFIGVDSGPAHMANAAQTPGVVLLGKYNNFRSYNPFSGFYALDDGAVKLVRNLTGPVKEIPVEDVTEAAAYVLAFARETAASRLALLPAMKNAAIESATSGIVTSEALAPQATQPLPSKSTDGLPRVLAFYLPQFHPIPENDKAHGSGFTEWNNVIKTKPLFRGHYQPRIPGELGYYDLRSVDVLRAQARLAQDHGITGFCFYYYYFGGKRLLYKPLENFINSDIDMPFCFLWANENWTRRWDGGDREIIIQQHHSPEDDNIFFDTILPMLKDPRYVCVDGKPWLGIYKPHLFPNIRATIDRWRADAEAAGLPGIYLVMADDWVDQVYHPRDFGFDASYEIPSNTLPSELSVADASQYDVNPDFEGRLIDYVKFARFYEHRPFPNYKRFKTVMAPWDNTPRYGNRSQVYVNSDNNAYRLWMTATYLDTFRRYEGDERLIFVHSWNEWCEGTYIEPDGRHGRRYLEETRDAVSTAKQAIEAFNAVGIDLHTVSLLSYLGQERIETLNQLFHTVNRARNEARGELYRMQHSEFWRLSAPLRFILHKVKNRIRSKLSRLKWLLMGG